MHVQIHHSQLRFIGILFSLHFKQNLSKAMLMSVVYTLAELRRHIAYDFNNLLFFVVEGF